MPKVVTGNDLKNKLAISLLLYPIFLKISITISNQNQKFNHENPIFRLYFTNREIQLSLRMWRTLQVGISGNEVSTKSTLCPAEGASFYPLFDMFVL